MAFSVFPIYEAQPKSTTAYRETEHRPIRNNSPSTSSSVLSLDSDSDSDRGERKPAPSNIPTHILIASQTIANLYNSGARLYVKEDLERIERQLSNCTTTPRFDIRCLDSTFVSSINPMFGNPQPVWKPVVKFRQYWDLVTANQRANAQHGVAMDDTYYISWVNLAYDQFAASEELDQARELRMAISRLRLSTTSGSFRRIISILLGCHRVTKIVCFGLGRITPSLSYEASGPKSAAEANNQRGRALMQHALALQARDRLRLPDDFSFDTLRHVELYAQDPAYSAADRAALQAFGFEVVGQHGAGGFALVDDNSLVITCHPSAPVTQILADIARPAAILTTADVDPIRTKKMHSLPLSSPLHFYDSPSPRTREMMREYKENTIEDPTNMISSTGLRMYIREAGSTDADMDMCPGF